MGTLSLVLSLGTGDRGVGSSGVVGKTRGNVLLVRHTRCVAFPLEDWPIPITTQTTIFFDHPKPNRIEFDTEQFVKVVR